MQVRRSLKLSGPDDDYAKAFRSVAELMSSFSHQAGHRELSVGMAPWRGVPVGMRASPLDSYVMRGQDKKKGFREIISSGASGSYFYVTPNRQVILPRYPIPRHNPNAGLLPTCRAVPCRAMPCFVLPVTRQSHACILSDPWLHSVYSYGYHVTVHRQDCV